MLPSDLRKFGLNKDVVERRQDVIQLASKDRLGF
jgi:hypothetical protein